MKIKITSLLLILVLALCITGCSSETSEDGVVRSKDRTYIAPAITETHDTNTIDPSKVREQREKELAENSEYDMSAEEKEALAEILKENGIDEELADSVTELETGAKVIGNAIKTVKQFPTLSAGEEYYGSYLGFHNKIKCLDNYQLVGLYLIGDEYLQGLYETEDEMHVLAVKFSTSVDSNTLREPFNTREYKEEIVINKYITVNFEGDSADTFNLMTVDFKNNKAYALYTAEGFSREQYIEIAKELVSNVISMDDYYIN